MNKLTRLITLMLVLIVASSGCSSSDKPYNTRSAAPPASVINPSADPSVEPIYREAFPAVDVAQQKVDQDLALQYLKSPNRDLRYKAVFDKAAELVARGLLSGKFGPTTKYDSWKTPMAKSYTGEGGVATIDDAKLSAYAWGIFKADGSLDFKRPIQGFLIRPSGGLQVQIERNGRNHPWSAYLDVDKTGSRSRTISVTSIGETRDSSEELFVYPRTLDELIQLDQDILDTLQRNMTEVFGPNWNK